MNNNFDKSIFDEWIKLRKQLSDAKRDKDFKKIIDICESILELDKRAKFIKIMTPVFYKEIGNAYLKLNDYPNAILFMEISKEKFIAFRKNNELNHPDDWLKDISSLEKSIDKIKLKFPL